MRDLRDEFALLQRRIDGTPITYLDSAATSLKPRSVLDTERRYHDEYTSNVHRGQSVLAAEATFAYESARRSVARFLRAEAASVVFTPNTSYALGTVAMGLKLTRDDVVLCSPNSHHANLLPWLRVAHVEWIGGDPFGALDPDEVVKAIRRYKPKVLAIGWVSNVTGVISPVAEICRRARELGVLTVVDAAQAAPHLPMDVGAIGCDFLAFSGHKMLGPTGIGVLWGRRDAFEALDPLLLSGGTIEHVSRQGYKLKRLPYRFEPGTPHISGAIGLGAATEYLEELGFDSIAEHERTLVDAMRDVLQSLPGVKVLSGGGGFDQIAIASIVPTTMNVHSDILCSVLSDTFKIITRSGFHCAHPTFDEAGFDRGAVRVSAYLYNTVEDIKHVGEALTSVLSRLARDAIT